MRKSKTKWVPVFDSDGKHVATVSAAGEMKSLGHSDEAAVRDEIRAVELQSKPHSTKGEYDGYLAHLHGTDVPCDGWAGWLEREINTHDAQQEQEAKERWQAEQAAATASFNALCDGHLADVEALIVNVAPAPPPPGWQAKVHAACDAIDEQTRHDVAASVVRHDAMGDLIPVDPDWREKVDAMFSVPQSDPHASFTAKFQTEHADDEPTQVATVVDERFDGSEP